jgi:FtsZ-binding cell division protein ZapB
MAGTDSNAPFRIEELEQENGVLGERLEQADEEIGRLRRENKQLRGESQTSGRDAQARLRSENRRP